MTKAAMFARGGGAFLLAAAVLLQPGSSLASPDAAGASAHVADARACVAPAPALVPSTSATERSQSGSAPERAYPAPGKPGECKSDADCGPGFACFHGGRCLCKPGRRLCKTTCADLQNDAANCGACSHACAAGDVCVQGGCRTPESLSSLAITPELSATGPFTLSYNNGAGGANECEWDHTEAAPERAAVAGRAPDGARFFVAYNGNLNNWANTDDSWGSSHRETPKASNSKWSTANIIGDPSATTSDFTGLDYVGYLAQRDTDSDSYDYCLGIAAADSADIASNTFDYDQGVQCTTPGYFADGESTKYDLGGTDLWAADDYDTYSGNPYDYPALQIMEDCEPGQPGCCTNATGNAGGTCAYTCSHDATHPCPVTDFEVLSDHVHDHARVTVNPCTHNGIMAYVTDDGGLWIRVWRPDGTQRSVREIDDMVPEDRNDVCCNYGVQMCNDGSHYCDTSDCPSGSQGQPCMRIAIHPHIVTTEISASDNGSEPAARCYAYVAYNASGVGDDGHTYYTAKLRVVDITDDSNPLVVARYKSKDPSATAYNDFEPEVVAAGPYVAWGFYSQAGLLQTEDPCHTFFEIREDSNGALSSINNIVSPPVSGYFPTMRHSDGMNGEAFVTGFGDYVEGISRGVGPGGQLFMSWAQPVCMNSGQSCIACNPQNSGCPSGEWSIVDVGAVVTP